MKAITKSNFFTLPDNTPYLLIDRRWDENEPTNHKLVVLGPLLRNRNIDLPKGFLDEKFIDFDWKSFINEETEANIRSLGYPVVDLRLFCFTLNEEEVNKVVADHVAFNVAEMSVSSVAGGADHVKAIDVDFSILKPCAPVPPPMGLGAFSFMMSNEYKLIARERNAIIAVVFKSRSDYERLCFKIAAAVYPQPVHRDMFDLFFLLENEATHKKAFEALQEEDGKTVFIGIDLEQKAALDKANIKHLDSMHKSKLELPLVN